MVEKQELSVREKKELVAKEEKTIPGRYYMNWTPFVGPRVVEFKV